MKELKRRKTKAERDNKFHLIDFLRDKMANIFKRLKKLVNIQDLLDIEDKDKIDVLQGRNDKLYIEESNYSKEMSQDNYEKEYDDDWDLEILYLKYCNLC